MWCRSFLAFCALGVVRAWSTRDGQIYDDNGTRYRVKGLSWFGFESAEDTTLHGLWKHPMGWYIDLLKSRGINTLRIPFSVDWVYYRRDSYPYEGLVAADPENQHKKGFEILDTLFDMTARAGINIMLDNHRNNPDFIGELWYEQDRRYSSETFMQSWFSVLDRYHNRSNLMAVDIKNEPHGRATWGTGDTSTDWRLFAEYAISSIHTRYPESSFLFVVEGIGWGKYLGNAVASPIRMPAGLGIASPFLLIPTESRSSPRWIPTTRPRSTATGIRILAW